MGCETLIHVIINGFHKSGSVLLWWIVKKSNPNSLCFYDPLDPKLFDIIYNPPQNSYKPLIWIDYLSDEFKEVELVFRHHHEVLRSKYANLLGSRFEYDVLPKEVGEVSPLFDTLNEIHPSIVIHSNRCHFILDKLAECYQCKFIHIVRNPIDTWVYYISSNSSSGIRSLLVRKMLRALKDKPFVGNYTLTKLIPKCRFVATKHHLLADYKLLCNYFDFNEPDDLLDVLLIVWAFTNYEAWKQSQCGKGMVIYYEDIVQAPKFWMRYMRDFTGVSFDTTFSTSIRSDYLTKSKSLRDTIVERLDRLGLLEKVRAFYPPSRWFGD